MISPPQTLDGNRAEIGVIGNGLGLSVQEMPVEHVAAADFIVKHLFAIRVVDLEADLHDR